ncbi:MAG TPA: hypothetical protein PK777_01245 [Thermoguttaceae bacterium]|nr:hypothetical protein [Thermoguttaceae bacterium]HPP51546.1 hypothetical protein [Thermoguttaceae bacterium]
MWPGRASDANFPHAAPEEVDTMLRQRIELARSEQIFRFVQAHRHRP